MQRDFATQSTRLRTHKMTLVWPHPKAAFVSKNICLLLFLYTGPVMGLESVYDYDTE